MLNITIKSRTLLFFDSEGKKAPAPLNLDAFTEVRVYVKADVSANGTSLGLYSIAASIPAGEYVNNAVAAQKRAEARCITRLQEELHGFDG